MSCNCNTAGGNTGVPFCSPLQGVMHSLIIVPKYKSDGTLNAIDLENDTIDGAFFTTKINEPLDKNRWYPLPFMENVENTRAESLNETANSGNIYRIKQGARTLNGQFFKQPAPYLARLEKWLCIDFGVYEVDVNGALAGTLSKDGKKLYPRYVLNGSLDPIHVTATDSTVSKNTISFQYGEEVKDSQIGLITSESMGDADLLSINGLFDAKLTATSVNNAGLIAKYTTYYGDILNPTVIQGLTQSEIVIFNATTSANVTVSSLTEIVAGTYDIYFSSQTSGDKLLISIDKDGIAEDAKEVLIP